MGKIKEVLIKSSQYLMDAAHSFRGYLKSHLTPKKGTKVQVEKPNVGVAWVAKTFPAWQNVILTLMKDLCDVGFICTFGIYCDSV